MANCVTKILRKTDSDKAIFKCVCCGFVTKPLRLTARIGRECPNPCNGSNPEEANHQLPGLLTRGASYWDANSRWEAAGKPVRTDEEVTEVVTKGCMNCDFFTGTQCLHCGCNISLPENERKSVIGIKFDPARFNKPRMATEDCPFHCKRCGHSVWKHLDGACECGNCKEFIDPRKAAKPP